MKEHLKQFIGYYFLAASALLLFMGETATGLIMLYSNLKEQQFTIREKDWDDRAILEFEKPIQVAMGKIGDELVIREVKRIRGEFNHDYFWVNNGRQDKMANGFEIWFNIHEYLA